MDLDFATASQLTRALRERTLSSRELIDHILARVDQYNGDLNAIVAFDLERARAAADTADAATARSEVAGPLQGLPMTVKDVWETEGLVTTSGAPELKDHVPRTDALAVGRLKAAGAIIFGKTNTPLYAGDFQTFNDVYGRTNNPWDTSRTAGGSSGGAAAAVAAGLTPLELGSDIGGSIRIPAHFNGVYGLKPSWGVVPSRGHIPGPPGNLVETDVNCNGPLARSLEDLGLALDVVAGPVPEDAPGWRLELDAGPAIDDVRALRIATVFDEGSDVLPLDETSAPTSRRSSARIVDAGARVDAVALPVPLADGVRSWQELVCPIFGMGLPNDMFDGLTNSSTSPVTSPRSPRDALSSAGTARGRGPTISASTSVLPGRPSSVSTTWCSRQSCPPQRFAMIPIVRSGIACSTSTASRSSPWSPRRGAVPSGPFCSPSSRCPPV